LKIWEPNPPYSLTVQPSSRYKWSIRQEPNELEALTGLQEGPKNTLPDGTRYEYDPILKRTVEVSPSGERFPVTLVDGKLQRDSQKADKRNGEAA
jgi:hypothetical protein